MLVRLVRDHLRGYRTPIIFVVVLQLVQTVATLYLPTLNADIIDKGVVNGDTGYILRVGELMLGVTLVQVVHSSLVVSVQQVAETAKNRAFFPAAAHQAGHR